MKALEKKVLNWADDKSLLERKNIIKQCSKLDEEVEEFSFEILNGSKEEAKMELGDVMVVSTIIIKQLDSSLKECLSLVDGLDCEYYELEPRKDTLKYFIENGNFEGAKEEIGCFILVCESWAQRLGTTSIKCLEMAYNKISKRKGKTINGTFVKD